MNLGVKTTLLWGRRSPGPPVPLHEGESVSLHRGFLATFPSLGRRIATVREGVLFTSEMSECKSDRNKWAIKEVRKEFPTCDVVEGAPELKDVGIAPFITGRRREVVCMDMGNHEATRRR